MPRRKKPAAPPPVTEDSYVYAVRYIDGSLTVASRDRERMVRALEVHCDPNHPEDPPRYGAHLVRRRVFDTAAPWEVLDRNGEPIPAVRDVDNAHTPTADELRDIFAPDGVSS